jgi:hypothetical protein
MIYVNSLRAEGVEISPLRKRYYPTVIPAISITGMLD